MADRGGMYLRQIQSEGMRVTGQLCQGGAQYKDEVRQNSGL